jgi:hypothetical protein
VALTEEHGYCKVRFNKADCAQLFRFHACPHPFAHTHARSHPHRW